jgi:hypothetical protein
MRKEKLPIDPNHIIAGLLSILVAALSGVMTFLNPNEKVSAHVNAGNNYDSLMNKIRMFWSIDCWRDESEQVLTERLKYFSDSSGGRATKQELNDIINESGKLLKAVEIDYKKNVMANMRWTHEWINSDGNCHEYLFLMEKTPQRELCLI